MLTCRYITRTFKLCRVLSTNPDLEVDSVLRKHTSKDSFSSVNKPFIQHPTSSVSQSFDKEKTAYIHTLRTLLNSFKDKLLSDSPDENSLRYTPKYTPKRDSTTLFLTKEELDAAQNNIRNRYLDIIGSESTSFLQQKRIRQEVTRDEGLEWLYESDVMFVDSGQEIDNKDRYIVTRKVDGTLYHNKIEEREETNSNFFRSPDQIYPPFEYLEVDALFTNALSSPDLDLETIMDSLVACYTTDNPTLKKRFIQVARLALGDLEFMNQIIYSKHVFTIVELALTEPDLDVKLLVNYLRETERDSLATDLIALHFLNDDRVCKDGEIYHDNKICIINGRSQSLLVQKKGLTRQEEDLMKAQSIINIDKSEIVELSASLSGGGGVNYTVTLKDPEIATQLHNHGRGNWLQFGNSIFEVLPVKDV